MRQRSKWKTERRKTLRNRRGKHDYDEKQNHGERRNQDNEVEGSKFSLNVVKWNPNVWRQRNKAFPFPLPVCDCNCVYIYICQLFVSSLKELLEGATTLVSLFFFGAVEARVICRTWHTTASPFVCKTGNTAISVDDNGLFARSRFSAAATCTKKGGKKCQPLPRFAKPVNFPLVKSPSSQESTNK